MQEVEIVNKEQVITEALEVKELDYIKLAQLARFTDEEIEFVRIFWEPAFNKNWIYINKELVVEWMGYTNNKDTMRDFHRKLKNFYEEGIDYKEVSRDHEIVKKAESFYSESNTNRNNSEKPGNRAKFYIITGECLKNLLLSAQTPNGRLVRRIYIKTENLVILMIEVVKAQQLREKDLLLQKKNNLLQEKEEELRIANSKSVELQSEIKNMEKLKPNGFVYLITTKIYSKNNIFRLGRTENLSKRLIAHSSARVKNDDYYYVFIYESEDVELLELLLRRLLKKYREYTSKDLYILPFHILQPYIQNICDMFHRNVVPITNQLIDDNIDFILNKPPNYIPSIIEPVKLLDPTVESKPLYYEQILDLYKDYHEIEILTPKEDINTMMDNVKIKCSHLEREVQVRTLFKKLGCPSCEKDKKVRELEASLEEAKEAEYKTIDEIDETTTAFEALKSRAKIRIRTQNEIIRKMAAENVRLLDEYTNFDAKFRYLCPKGHVHSTSWNAFKKLKQEYCRPCRGIKTQIQNVRSHKYSDEEELKEMAQKHDYVFIGRTDITGIYEIRCPHGHSLKRYKRDFDKKCMPCSKAARATK
jgi:hypothetical protein